MECLNAMDLENAERCKHCQRLKYGHPRPIGKDKCHLEPIDDDEDLRQDDLRKMKLKENEGNERSDKWKHDDSSETENNKKQQSGSDKDEELKKLKDEREKLKKIMEESEKQVRL